MMRGRRGRPRPRRGAVGVGTTIPALAIARRLLLLLSPWLLTPQGGLSSALRDVVGGGRGGRAYGAAAVAAFSSPDPSHRRRNPPPLTPLRPPRRFYFDDGGGDEVVVPRVGSIRGGLAVPRMGFGLGVGMGMASRRGPEGDRISNDEGEGMPSPRPPRRKKKNKYAEFSKVDNAAAEDHDAEKGEGEGGPGPDLDPWEVMIAESERKLERMAMEKDARRNGNSSPLTSKERSGENRKRERNTMTFPDASKIDPYDPTTYGYVELGIVVGPHGVRGEVKLRSTTDFATQRLQVSKPTPRHLKPKNRRSPREVTLLEGGRRLDGKSVDGDEVYLLRFDGVGDRDAAAALRGATLYARGEDGAEVGDALGDDEYAVGDLVGLDVFLDGEWARDEMGIGEGGGGSLFVGTIGGVVLAGEMSGVPGLGQDLLEVVLAPRTDGTRTEAFEPNQLVLIPFVPEIVPSVDLIGSIVRICPPKGLLDLTYVRERKVRIRGFLPPAGDD